MQDILAACKTALAAVTGKCRAVLSKRKPLQRSAAAKAPAVKLYNPRFEEDFVSGKDYDPDRSASSGAAPARPSCSPLHMVHFHVYIKCLTATTCE